MQVCHASVAGSDDDVQGHVIHHSARKLLFTEFVGETRPLSTAQLAHFHRGRLHIIL